MTRVLGLTGGIATGKSTVVSIFRALGFPIVDGDEIARLIVQPGEPALAASGREKTRSAAGHRRYPTTV